MSINQEIIDFMNGTKKKKNRTKNETKYPTNRSTRDFDVEQQEGLTFENADNEDDEGISNQSPGFDATLESPSPNRPPRNKSPQLNNINNHSTTMMMRMNHIQTLFYQTMIEWIQIDQQQIYPLLQSIHHLRQRMQHASQYAAAFGTNEHDKASLLTSTSVSLSPSLVEWKNYGYRHRASSTTAAATEANGALLLTKDDLQMTIQHSLQHQERMMVQLRHLLSELSQMMNRMSRRCDDLYQVSGGGGDGANMIDVPTYDAAMEECQVVFIAFAKELYRKQVLVTQMLDVSTTTSFPGSEDVFGTTNHVEDTNNNINDTEGDFAAKDTERNHRPIRQCIQEWSYTSKHSYIYPYRTFVQECIQRYRLPK